MKKSDNTLVMIKNFTMTLGSTTVINKLNFEIIRGETFGLLGANGSGKTTILRALLGIYRPTSGSLLIDGKAYAVDGNVKLGYLPEERGLYKKESVLSVMVYFGRLKGMRSEDAKKWSLDYLQRVDLADKASTRIDKISGGQQQKVQLGVTIMNDPELLILDEPTKGFDPVNRRLLMTIIEERRKAGTTVVFVTHQMDEVERLCDRIILLKDGAAEAYGTIASVKKAHGGASLDDIFVSIYSKTEAGSDA